LVRQRTIVPIQQVPASAHTLVRVLGGLVIAPRFFDVPVAQVDTPAIQSRLFNLIIASCPRLGGVRRSEVLRECIDVPHSAGDVRGDTYMSSAPRLSVVEVKGLFDKISNWGRWGKDDERGALNFITPAKRAAAARLAQSGETVPMALPLATTSG